MARAQLRRRPALQLDSGHTSTPCACPINAIAQDVPRGRGPQARRLAGARGAALALDLARAAVQVGRAQGAACAWQGCWGQAWTLERAVRAPLGGDPVRRRRRVCCKLPAK